MNDNPFAIDPPAPEAPLTALDKARLAAQAIRDAGGTVRRLTPRERLERNPRSLRASINVVCWDCEGGDADPGVRKRIGSCTIKSCGNWPNRPYQKGAEETEEEVPG